MPRLVASSPDPHRAQPRTRTVERIPSLLFLVVAALAFAPGRAHAQASCNPDVNPPDISVGHPLVTFELEPAWEYNRFDIVTHCGITYTDDCWDPALLLHGIVNVQVDSPDGEQVLGGPGYFYSSGMAADWYSLVVNLDRNQIGTRTYTVTYTILDRADNWGYVDCVFDVVDPLAAPTEDLCDGVDNDGDGLIDEDFAPEATNCGVGACAATATTACVGGAVVDPCQAGAPSAERCGSGIDEDCDGLTDEGFDPGSICTAGIGACAVDGVTVCTADGAGTECSAAAGAPSVELCGTGVDEDCDGLVDEDFVTGAVCSAGLGACAANGTIICTADGTGTECSAAAGAPSVELCGNGVDDDCDGLTDEGFALGQVCSAGLGACAADGLTVCAVDGTGVVCDATPGPATEELCGNDLDDDCDGLTDEGFDAGAACSVGQGACAVDGTLICTPDGLGTACDAVAGAPTAELCGNDLDDDCDGLTDEGFDAGAACSAGVGACTASGTVVCTADRLDTVCDAVAGASPTDGVELCGNGIDDDCDSLTDEGFDAGAACSAGIGACSTSGTVVCTADRLDVVCDAVAGDPTAELCGNGLDDDCDGLTDEGFDTGAACSVGVGACADSGTIACTADGTGTTCSAAAGAPAIELCGNGVDDDCDGQTDEGFDLGTACSAGLGECRVDGVTVCTADGLGAACDAVVGPSPTHGVELCGTGLDEDCDGLVDEDLETGAACTSGLGACAADGTVVCTADLAGTECSATADPSPTDGLELCGNGIDDDCDGQTDEGLETGGVCTAGQGACATTGTVVCTADGTGTECDAAAGASPTDGVELCGNGIDDDCDGLTDEGFDTGAACSAGLGACAADGALVCNADGTGTECSAVAGPSPTDGVELCGNGVDDDCDGQTDEGFAIGGACSAGTGACAADGTIACTADGTGTECSATAGQPGIERCGTGVDEDCDGLIDEDFATGGACSVGTGTCAADGIVVCTADGAGTACSATAGQPAIELCGTGLDEDCDGLVDEGFAIGGACTVGEGVCAADGTVVCTADGAGTECDAVAGAPSVELCGTGLDEDCDGLTDEGFDAGAACSAGTGACAVAGTMVCTGDGTGTVCDAIAGLPTSERCGTGVDEDCDGLTDEGFDTGAACSAGTGACAVAGTIVCTADGTSTECGAVATPPSVELCGTGIDEDCDGLTDEGFDNGAACTAGIGTCAAAGNVICTADGLLTMCDAVPSAPSTELCATAADEDCDGTVDEPDCAFEESCEPDVKPPDIVVGTPDVYFELSDSYVENRNRIFDLCDMTWTDNCAGANMLNGITSITVDNPAGDEVIGGTGGAYQSPGIFADWHDIILNLDRTQIGPRVYTVKFAVLDYVYNWGYADCRIHVVDAQSVPDLCDGIDDDGDGMVDEDFVPFNTTCGIGACSALGQTACVDGVEIDNCTPGLPSPDLCASGADEDCDGQVDEGFVLGAPCSAGEGACQVAGVTVCSPDNLGTVCSAVAGSPDGVEQCGNDIDEDCDGQLDNGFALGQPCATGAGACAADGVTECGADGQSVVCGAVAGVPSLELCGNGLDDDCDGQIDEGFDTGAACSAGVGACAVAGLVACTADGTGTECDAVPPAAGAELCGNGVDDDCDGQTDEGFDTGGACTVGTGACATAGVIVCTADGTGAECDAEGAAAIVELCGNGVDDDCDGQIDEGFGVGDACTVGTGACAADGVMACTPDGTGSVCGVEPGSPAAELCGNGIDDDCDGQTDEGFTTGTACQTGLGVCTTSGVTICSPDGLGTTCDAEIIPAGDELCSTGLDEDCDGAVDEGFSQLGAVCSDGTGACESVGFYDCSADRTTLVCNATPGVPMGERCGNSIDENCDGQLDEGFDLGVECWAGYGACRGWGVMACDDRGTSSTCDAVAAPPQPELCGNGIDDDCDLQVDEGFEAIGTACIAGLGECQGPGSYVCDPDGHMTCAPDGALPPPGVELCGNAIDEDCDGALDNGYDIGAACSVGVGACVRDGAVVCTPEGDASICDVAPGPPEFEACDFIDNDCDGLVDENEACNGDYGPPSTSLSAPIALGNYTTAQGRWWDALAVTRDGDYFAAAYKNAGTGTGARVALFDATTGERLWLSTVDVWSEGCDFNPDDTRLYCAHLPRPDWSHKHITVFDVLTGALVDRVVVDMGPDREPMTDPWWGDNLRVSSDGRWVALGGYAPDGGEVVIVEIGPDDTHQIAARFPLSGVDEVAFAHDSATLYASSYTLNSVWRARFDGAFWNADGLRFVNAPTTGLDIDGTGQIIASAFTSRAVLILRPDGGAWNTTPFDVVPVTGNAYDLCADPRPNATFAWAASQNGDVQVIDTATGTVIANDVLPLYSTDGIALDCARFTGQPFLVTRGQLHRWLVP